MGKLHEVLVVDRDLENVAKKVVEEGIVTFTKKAEHFRAAHKRLEMFDDARQGEAKGQEEILAMTTTVPDKLGYIAEHIVRHLDCLRDKEITNTVAVASVEVDGHYLDGGLLPPLPATLLLALEGKLAWLRKLYEEIPTLEPGVKWVPDPDQGPNVFRAEQDQIRHKTEKTIKPMILYDATDKHPAQVKELSVDVPVGNYVLVQWSGRISPAKKSELLARIDKLIGAVKQARQRANSTEVEQTDWSLGKIILDYINAPLA